MHLNYVRFDLIVYHANLEKLKKFTKLKKLVLSNNYLNSFILLSKIECLNTVESIMVYDNEVLRCVSMMSFIVYRFQHIKEVSVRNLCFFIIRVFACAVQWGPRHRAEQESGQAAVLTIRQNPLHPECLHEEADCLPRSR